MDADLDTLATALYVTTDDLLTAHPTRVPPRPAVGIAPKISDAELLTVAVMQALLGYTSEARWLRYAGQHLAGMFPYLPQQSGDNKRLRKLAATMSWLVTRLGADTTLSQDDVWLVDSTPVECARSRETVQRSDLAGWAEYGYCASHSRFFWGLRLHLVTTVHGLPVGWALTGAKADERQALADVLAAARSFISDLGAMLTAVRRAPVPTLCAVDGYCLGGAMELTMACDLRVASTTAVFGMPEIKVGVPSVLDAALLQQHLGLAKAKEMLLTGDLYRGAELEPLGFVNKVVAPEDLHEATAGFARRVSGHSPVAFASQKRLFETWQNVGLQASIDASIGEFAEVFAHETTQERIRCYWDLSD